jgi:hypothetical protein
MTGIVIPPAIPLLRATTIVATGMTSMVMMRTIPAKVMGFPAAMIRIMAVELLRAISPGVATGEVAVVVGAVTVAAAGTRTMGTVAGTETATGVAKVTSEK